MGVAVGIIILAFIVVMIVAKVHDERAGIVPAKQRAQQNAALAQARRQAEIVCPHCQVKGRVRGQPIKVKRGISGGKATGAILTGGISLLGTGLSRKVPVTEMYCGNCGTTWQV